VSVVNLLPVEYSYSAEALSDTPIFNALAASTPLFSRHVTPARPPLQRSCVMPRSPRVGGRHRRLSGLTDHGVGGGRHHLIVAQA
jgi:hypothetical protein